jgi:hypothetical protein
VSPHVWYGMTSLLIRDVISCESCLVAWGKAQNVTWIHMGEEGPEVRGNLSTSSGA